MAKLGKQWRVAALLQPLNHTHLTFHPHMLPSVRICSLVAFAVRGERPAVGQGSSTQEGQEIGVCFKPACPKRELARQSSPSKPSLHIRDCIGVQEDSPMKRHGVQEDSPMKRRVNTAAKTFSRVFCCSMARGPPQIGTPRSSANGRGPCAGEMQPHYEGTAEYNHHQWVGSPPCQTARQIVSKGSVLVTLKALRGLRKI
mmetsp:Transcript_40858/g.68513  ORF Transcript_40858/g.68513 Transcript_40858/m.68513 type:complete len:200 (-) Transcript_40858:291-890(-)